MTEKISVIIVTRNREKILAGCLKSLIYQTRRPDEIIVVDNMSIDNTKQVTLSFSKKLNIKYFVEKQIGIPYARNKGLKHASGELILMLDDDCEADKFWVEEMIKAHQKYPKAWVIQGRIYSLPKKGLYSMVCEFSRLLYVRNFAKNILPIGQFFSKYFNEEIEVLMCDTKNFSIKTSCIKKHKLSFDTRFYRGSDADFGRQIISKYGSIIFCPQIKVGHWERNSLAEYLEQRWHTGRTNAKIEIKWKLPSKMPKILSLKTPLTLLFFCKTLNQLPKFPILLALLFLDRVYRLNGYFYEKRILSLKRNNEAI